MTAAAAADYYELQFTTLAVLKLENSGVGCATCTLSPVFCLRKIAQHNLSVAGGQRTCEAVVMANHIMI